MGWTEVIVGAIILASWIASNIREMQKAAAAKAPPPPAGDAPAAGAPPRETDELQDFMKEIRRRMGEPEPQTAERANADVLVEDPRQIERPRWEAPPRPKTKLKKKRPPEPTPHLVRTAEVTALSPDYAKSPVATPLLGGGQKKSASPVVSEVVKLLKSPAGLSTAFLLREILSEPMCKRRPESRRKGL